MSNSETGGGCSRTDTLSLYNERTLQRIYYFRRGSADAYRVTFILYCTLRLTGAHLFPRLSKANKSVYFYIKRVIPHYEGR